MFQFITQKKVTRYIFLVVLLLALACVTSIPVSAQQTDLDRPFANVRVISQLANAIFKLAIVLCVLAAAIYIAIGAFYYFGSSGNADLAGRGKELISRSIIGLILALISWVILNTIHPQFTKLNDPKVNSVIQYVG